jgi:hypothetical protein
VPGLECGVRTRALADPTASRGTPRLTWGVKLAVSACGNWERSGRRCGGRKGGERADGSDRGLSGCRYGERGTSGGEAKEKEKQEKEKKDSMCGMSGIASEGEGFGGGEADDSVRGCRAATRVLD